MIYNINKIETKLSKLPGKAAKLNYLNNYLFGLRKKKAEYNFTDLPTLERLKEKTAEDYEIYVNGLDNGKLVYWSNSNNKNPAAKKLGIKNEQLLKKRIRLEFEHDYLPSKILLFESLIQKVEASEENDIVDVKARRKLNKAKKPKPEIKPVFKRELLKTIIDSIQDYFPDQRKELRELLNGKKLSKQLLFNGSAKALLDYFKQLMKGQFLIIAVQKDLETWISKNFMFLHNNEWKPITTKYASKIISGNERAAKGNRLIEVEKTNGKFQIRHLEITNRK